MAYPRQKLYDTNYTGFVKELLFGRLNDGKTPDFANAFESLTGLRKALPMSRGRLGIYFGVKSFVTPEKNGVIMSPFTIFDAVNMVVTAGGVPLFCDSESPTSPHLHPDTIREMINEKTAAVIVTHYHSVNPHIREIAALCREHGVALIEDCAIALGSRIDGLHVGGFGDVGVYSFGLFKFVSTFFGGAVYFKDHARMKETEAEISSWPKMGFGDLRSYFFKGVKLSLLTHKILFNLLTFPLFRFGYLHDVEFIKNQAKNDPNPFLRESFPEHFKRQPSDFQVREFVRQFRNIENDRQKRLQNAGVYYEKLKDTDGVVIPACPEAWDSMLNFPVSVAHDRDEVVKQIMRAGYDVGIYFYRNCAEIPAFSGFARPLPNLEAYVANLVILPAYPEIPGTYAEALAAEVKKIVTDKE